MHLLLFERVSPSPWSVYTYISERVSCCWEEERQVKWWVRRTKENCTLQERGFWENARNIAVRIVFSTFQLTYSIFLDS